jgi:hypothetical protein
MFRIMGTITGISDLPVGVLVGLGAVLVVEVVLDVISLVDLYRRPIDRVALRNKWVWVAIIVLVNLIGSILYLIVGRKAAPVADQPPSTPGGAKRDIGDALYGPRDGSNPS